MKLSSRDIAIIEDLLTQREQGKSNPEIAASCGLTKGYQQTALATTFTTLKSIGVNVPKSLNRGQALKREYAEFRAWKAAQARKTESTLIERTVNLGPAPLPRGWTNGGDPVRVTGL